MGTVKGIVRKPGTQCAGRRLKLSCGHKVVEIGMIIRIHHSCYRPLPDKAATGKPPRRPTRARACTASCLSPAFRPVDKNCTWVPLLRLHSTLIIQPPVAKSERGAPCVTGACKSWLQIVRSTKLSATHQTPSWGAPHLQHRLLALQRSVNG